MNLYYNTETEVFSLGHDRLTAMPINPEEIVERFNAKEVTLSKFKASAVRHYQNESNKVLS